MKDLQNLLEQFLVTKLLQAVGCKLQVAYANSLQRETWNLQPKRTPLLIKKYI